MKNSEELAEEYYDQMANHYGSVKDLAKLLRDFATYHVTEALKAAGKTEAILIDDSRYSQGFPYSAQVDQNAITNAYPLTNIK